MKTKATIQERGVMLTDYFCGTSGVMLPVSIDRLTTLGEVVDSLEQEISSVWDHCDYVAEFHDCLDWEAQVKEEIADIKERVKGRGGEIYSPDLEFTFDDLDECDEVAVAIFTIEFEGG